MDWIRATLLLTLLAVVIVFSELIRIKLKLSIHFTRKFVHILTGILIAITPMLLERPDPLLVIAGAFAVINLVAIKKKWMPGIHAVVRVSYGTVFYPISFFILVLLLWQDHRAILVIAMLIMAIADAMAAVIGESIEHPIRYQFDGEPKSLQGSMAMLISSFIISVVGLSLYSSFESIRITAGQTLWIAGIVSIIVTACESISYKGSDNLTVPLGAAFTLHFMLTHPSADNIAFSVGVVFALFIAGSSYFLHFLDGSGAVSTFLLGVVIFGTGRWEFSIPILLFFFLSSLLSKLGKRWKQRFADTFQKGGRRDAGQVIANGGIAGIIVLLWNYFPHDIWYFLFIGSISAVTADTWATEIGVFSRKAPRDILTFRRVAPGTSGGVTPLGLAGALLGSFIIVYLGSLVTQRYHHSLKPGALFSIVIIAGLVGSIVDSILGTTVQAQYQCGVCGKVTEKKLHCQNHRTTLIAGYRSIDNDVVNFICAISGALFTWLAYQLLS